MNGKRDDMDTRLSNFMPLISPESRILRGC